MQKSAKKVFPPPDTTRTTPTLFRNHSNKASFCQSLGSREFFKLKLDIQSTFNNTIVTISTATGETVSWASSGAIGFKGAKKGTPFAAQIAAEKASKEAVGQGMKKAEVIVNGPGAGRETAIRAIQAAGLEIVLIRDITPVPHNGCRPPKKRRI